MMKLRLTRPWRAYRKGQVVDVPGGLATEWLARGIAVLETQQPLIETAAVQRDAEAADATKRKRGRPRAIPQPDTPDSPSG